MIYIQTHSTFYLEIIFCILAVKVYFAEVAFVWILGMFRLSCLK